jgi:F0F1-type ATP synthase membrane subunit b/b'
MMNVVQIVVMFAIVGGVLIFFLRKLLFDSTQGAVNRLNKETEDVRVKQSELNEKIKQANEELAKRKKEADDLVAKMTDEATEKAKEEREKIINKAREEGEEILAKAQRSKEDLRKVIEKEMEMKTVDFTIEILKRLLSKRSNQALHDSLIEDFLSNLEKVDMGVMTQEINSAEIVTAVPLSDLLKAKAMTILKKKLNRNVAVTNKQDSSIVSGAVLRLGSLALDGSLKNLLFEEGTAIKEKIERS